MDFGELQSERLFLVLFTPQERLGTPWRAKGTSQRAAASSRHAAQGRGGTEPRLTVRSFSRPGEGSCRWRWRLQAATRPGGLEPFAPLSVGRGRLLS